MENRSPFLVHALEWIFPDGPSEHCPACGYDWAISSDDALTRVVEATSRYHDLLEGRNGMTPAADGGWNGTRWVAHEFVHHLADVDTRAALDDPARRVDASNTHAREG